MSECGCHADQAARSSAAEPRYRRILWVALAVNAAMFLVEVAASLFSGSVALQADALDFLGDAANYAVGLIVLGLAMRWRVRAALGKGVVMALFGLWVAASAIGRVLGDALPQAGVMGGIGLLALAANFGVAVLLYRYRSGDSNQLSVWLCTRNDAIANVAVILAGLAVWLTGTRWPDIAVAAVIAGLGLTGAWRVIRAAMGEHRAAGTSIAAAE